MITLITFAQRRPEDVWAIQFKKFQQVDGGKTIYKDNADEIAAFLGKFGYPQCIYRNCNGCVAINCHGEMSTLTDTDMVVRNESNHLSVMSICDFTKTYQVIEKPVAEYGIEVIWQCDILPTTYIGGRYDSIDVVTAMLKSKKDELGITDDFIGKAEEVLAGQLPKMGVINSDVHNCARYESRNCIVKCWRSK